MGTTGRFMAGLLGLALAGCIVALGGCALPTFARRDLCASVDS